MKDPLVAALAAALEQTLTRGVDITPLGSGWHVRLAAPAVEPPFIANYDDASERQQLAAQARRSW